MKTYKLFNLICALVFAASLLAMPAGAAAQEPLPDLQVFVTQDRIEALDWPLGTLLTLDIYSPGTSQIPAYTTTRTVGPAPWNPSTPAAVFDLNGTFHYQVGDRLTVGGGGITKEHTVVFVTVTRVNFLTEIVTGTTEPGAQVEVDIHVGNMPFRVVTAEADGSWSADFSTSGNGQDPYNLPSGINGAARRLDDDGDASRADFPHPAIVANPYRQVVNAVDWPLGTMLTMTIDDPNTPGPVDYTAQAPIISHLPESSWIAADFDLQGNYYLKPGDVIKMTDGIIPKTLTVAPMQVTGINLQADTVSGTGTPGASITVGATQQGTGFVTRWVTAGAGGTWTANFHDPGNGRDDPATVDIQPGSSGGASQWDEDDDETKVDWVAPGPIIQAGPNQGFVYAREWPSGAQIHMTVARSGSTIYTADATVGPCGAGNPGSGPCGPNDAYFDLGYQDPSLPRLDLEGGDFITLDGGGINRSMVVSALEITEINAGTDTLKGIADIGREVGVGTCDGHSVSIMPDSGGHWVANFAPFDLLPGMCGGATQFDEYGNYTQQGWVVPNPFISASLTEHLIQVFEQETSPWIPWPVGTLLTLTIDDPANGVGVDYTDTATMAQNPDNPADPNDRRADFTWPDIGLQPGFLLTVFANGSSKTLTIPPLEVTDIDVQADTIAGTAEAGAQIWACLNVDNQCAHQETTADSSGNWLVAYWPIEILPGMDISVATGDADGDQIWGHWRVPSGPPVINSLTTPLTPTPLGQSIEATVDFSDPDVGDSHTIAWDWGDGSTTSSSSPTADHLYTQPGVYSIGVTVTDTTGESASITSSQFVVIYDPTGGFVTGGGWITSPAGAYPADPALTGRASFGFVSKYLKGAKVPTGNTEFQFKVADLNFKSTAYDWLVVAGSKAQYKGTGTINGAGEYGFMLNASDGSPDRFRIKIWDKTTGQIIYDNQLGASDTTDPTTALGGGSIAIQKGK